MIDSKVTLGPGSICRWRLRQRQHWLPQPYLFLSPLNNQLHLTKIQHFFLIYIFATTVAAEALLLPTDTRCIASSCVLPFQVTLLAVKHNCGKIQASVDCWVLMDSSLPLASYFFLFFFKHHEAALKIDYRLLLDSLAPHCWHLQPHEQFYIKLCGYVLWYYWSWSSCIAEFVKVKLGVSSLLRRV